MESESYINGIRKIEMKPTPSNQLTPFNFRPLIKYRVQKKSLSSNKFKSARQIWSIYRDVEGFSTIRSLNYFSGYAINAVKKRLCWVVCKKKFPFIWLMQRVEDYAYLHAKAHFIVLV